LDPAETKKAVVRRNGRPTAFVEKQASSSFQRPRFVDDDLRMLFQQFVAPGAGFHRLALRLVDENDLPHGIRGVLALGVGLHKINQTIKICLGDLGDVCYFVSANRQLEA
jgi:hypothetical protein